MSKSFQDDHHSLVVIRGVLFLLGCYIILLLKRNGWKRLVGHPKDRGKHHRNSRTNSLQPGEDDVDRLPREASDRNGKLIDKMSAIR
jgi:hypothetical protein